MEPVILALQGDASRVNHDRFAIGIVIDVELSARLDHAGSHVIRPEISNVPVERIGGPQRTGGEFC
ncbi:hypothetical protein D9M73_266600 [compost metagenome]